MMLSLRPDTKTLAPSHHRMRKPQKNEPASSPWDSDVNLLIWLATCASVFSFLFFYRQGQVLLYGDAIAHINIARRVFDSRTPGLLQLGTVWLPLPHLLMIPFLISKQMWQSGAGGSIASMAAYVFGIVGIFRLTRGVLAQSAEPDRCTRIAAWTGAFVYAANPNLIYMQSTAMGEAVYLAFFIWAVVYFAESMRVTAKALIKCGLCLAAACLTRYDGWFLAVTMVIAIVMVWLLRRRTAKDGVPAARSAARAGTTGSGGRAALPGPVSPSAVVRFILISAAAPALWLAYNGLVYRNPLEFENGPYSAKAIERRTQSAGNPGHPGSDNPILAGMYFLKSAEANLAANQGLQRAWLLLALGAAVVLILRRRSIPVARTWPLLFLLVPVPFYTLSIAYGGVPIFVPYWWPFSHYNVRYGLNLLPAFAVALAILVRVILRSDLWNRRFRLGCTIAVFAIIAASYTNVWHATPICLKEAQINMRTRNQLQAELAHLLNELPHNSILLMYLGDQVGALERAGIPLKCTINEGNHRVWKQPTDAEGLWERALANPTQYADYVLAFEGDPVWQAVHNQHLHELIEIHVTGQAPAILYRAR
ncbi:MAG TPA: hypothetical protein VKQ11_16290 [Candidatus Sulfotelmatobacter sp.]|nr:hypothetical protein [Candidatus Sulfotelmatobacter sp.]